MNALAASLNWVEQGKVPDALVRAGIRRLCRQRLAETGGGDCEHAAELTRAFAAQLGASPIALATDKANEQHYELPPRFFELALGPHRKYSACHWDENTHTLGEAEARALELSCEHAGLANGQDILELGCGWGSLTLWMAARYPDARITAVSNSAPQRQFIEEQARQRKLGNLRIITADMNAFSIGEQFDRVVSVEMFEHMRNWPELFARVAGWLKPGGRFFMHVFVHRHAPYLFEARDESDWMSRYFFTGGMMPSDDLALHFQEQLRLVSRWRWDGTHYEKTANAWLAEMDAKRALVTPVLEETYGRENAELWRQRWRIFFMACAELFGYDRGQTWWVSHYLFERP
ncbi:class I SAM-dependent methyltransferase [Betaproteobacteria bacterium SCN2]|jgi:cyclopropane-fatty-acyl-phospholipid synthase|nr:class I SAM-dependent methyltransferase [Betaproteobacteria bacterium SCN2]